MPGTAIQQLPLAGPIGTDKQAPNSLPSDGHSNLYFKANDTECRLVLLAIAESCLSLPVSNAWPERGASAVKRLKSMLGSSLNNDMLASLMQVSINGPELRTSRCDNLIEETVKKWFAQQRRKIVRGKEGNAVKRADVPVQAEIGENDTVTQPDMDLSQTEPDQTVSTQDENNEHQNAELEVVPAVSILKLPEDSDSESGDLDFEYD